MWMVYTMLKNLLWFFLVCMAKLVDAFEDVLHGMLQQYRRLDIAGKILTLRMGGYIVIYMAVYAVHKKSGGDFSGLFHAVLS